MNMKRKPLILAGLVVLLFCSFGVVIRARGPQSRRRVPKGWPEQFGNQKLYFCESGFVYAGKKSAADQLKKVLGTVVKDLRQDGVTEPTDGLILVMDSEERPPFEITRLIEALSKADMQTAGEKSDTLKSIAETQEKIEKQGMDTDTLLSLMPIPITPAVLPEIVKELPEDVDRQIGWCIVVPTDRCVKAGMKKMIDTAIKKKRMGLMERLAMRALMPLVQQKAVQQVKRSRQALLYELLLEGQKDWPEEQREERVKAYKQKLGLVVAENVIRAEKRQGSLRFERIW